MALTEPAPPTTRQQLLALLASRPVADPDAAARLARVPVQTAPASATQRRFWFMEQVEPGNPAYRCPSAMRLTGPLDHAALQRAVDTVVARHEILRTTYELVGDELSQRVHPAVAGTLELVDLRAEPLPTSEQVVAAAARGESDPPADLTTGPVWRARLFRTGAAEHVLVCDVHHIAFDGWSTALLWRELGTAYNAYAAGRAPELPEVAVQYTDYARWHHSVVDGPQAADDLDFWRHRLDGARPPELPFDQPASGRTGDEGRLLHRRLDPALMTALSRLAAAESTSLFSTLVTGLALVVARWSQTEDVLLGTAVLGRDRPEFAQLIGCLINTVVLRVRPADDDTGRELVRRVGTELRESLRHAQLPFDRLVRELAPARDGARIPLVPVHLTLEESGRELPRFTGLTASAVVPDLSAAKFDLGVNVRTQPDGSALLGLLFHTDRFTEPTAGRFLAQLEHCLDSLSRHPDRPWSAVEVLDRAEEHLVVAGFNATDDSAEPELSPPSRTLPALVADQAWRRPDAEAIVADGARLTYADLTDRASRVAAALAGRGVGPGCVVALAVRRSPELAMAMLGVLAAGAAYLPVDPDYPAERIHYLLHDASVTTMVTGPDVALGAPGADTVSLAELLDPAAPVAEPVGPDLDDPAYVIYTSGSTGAPKGAVLHHRGVANSLRGINTRFGIDHTDTVLALSSPSFDASVYDILGTLITGGRVVMVHPSSTRDPGHWVDLVQTHAVTVWHSAPALAEVFVSALKSRGAPAPSLRRALVSGDWIPLTLPDRMRAVAPRLEFISMGGATECSVDSVAYRVGAVDPGWASIPYGTPLPNQQAYVLGTRDALVPIGVEGELCYGGLGVGAGYLGRPGLTAERFPTVQLPGRAPERLYRSGDRARWRSDGTLELIGRMDRQLKIHGLRVEPGEIEAVLRQHDDVAEAVVVPNGEGTDRRLVCCYVPARTDPGAGALSAWLGARLPAALVPTVLTPVEAFPLSVHNKVDRAAVARLAVDGAGVGRSETAGPPPQTAAERQVAAVWSRLLDLPPLHRDDDFFALGGDSYLAIKAVLETDARLRLLDLFTHPTVRALGARLDALALKPAGAGPRPVLQQLGEPTADGPVLVGVPFGGGSAGAFYELARRLPDLGVLALDAPGHDPAGADEPMVAVPELVDRAVAEIAALDRPVVVYGHCSGVATAVELAVGLESTGVDVRTLYLAAALPDLDPDASLQRSAGDAELYAALSSLGAFDGPLDSAQRDRLMGIARHDLFEALFAFRRAARGELPRVAAPLRVVFGSADPSTTDPSRAADWEHFGSVASVDVIEGGDHYFLTTATDALAEVVRRHEQPLPPTAAAPTPCPEETR